MYSDRVRHWGDTPAFKLVPPSSWWSLTLQVSIFSSNLSPRKQQGVAVAARRIVRRVESGELLTGVSAWTIEHNTFRKADWVRDFMYVHTPLIADEC